MRVTSSHRPTSAPPPFFLAVAKGREVSGAQFPSGRVLAKEESLLMVYLIHMHCKDYFLLLLISVWSINV